MRKKLAVFLSLVLCLCSLNVGIMPAKAIDSNADDYGNLLENPGFEEAFGDTGWGPDGCWIVPDVKHTGENSARLGTGETGCYYVLTEGFKPGETFVLKTWGCVSTEGELGIVNAEFRNDDGLILRSGVTFTNVGEMQEYKTDLVVPEGTTKILIALYKETNVRGFAYFDDLYFGKKIEKITENENILTNPDFENWISGWEPDGVRYESEKVKNGTGAANIGPGEGGGYFSLSGDFSDAEKITISGWGCVSKQGEKALFGVDMFDNYERAGATRIGKYQIEFTDVDEYGYKSLDFDVAEGTKMITVFMYKEAGEGGMAYFDDLSVIIDKESVNEPVSGNEKRYINNAPEGVESVISSVPDEYAYTADGIDYYYANYKCYKNSAADAGMPKNANCVLTERLCGYGDRTEWYERTYKELMRAMWVWNFDILEDETKADEFFAFVAAKNINTLYMNTGYDETGVSRVVTHPEQYKAFVKRAHAMNVKVEALDGESTWVRPENHSIALGKINEIIAYNKNAAPAERFDGIHHDNEPYTLPEWDDSMGALATAYLDLAKASCDIAKANGLTYAVDIPFWYDAVSATANVEYNGEVKGLNCHIIDTVDYIGIMAYRDTALGTDGIIYHTEDEVKYAAYSGKEVVIGVETYDVPDHEANPPKITFYQEGEDYMNAEIAKVIDHYSNAFNRLDNHAAPGFKGMAIHYYDTYKDLPAGRRDN